MLIVYNSTNLYQLSAFPALGWNADKCVRNYQFLTDTGNHRVQQFSTKNKKVKVFVTC